MMKISARGLAEIAAHEGIVLSRYKDSVGIWTIGIGHTAAAGYPDPETIHRDLTMEEVMEIFARDVETFEDRVNRAFRRVLSPQQFDAAVSFDFNTGGIFKALWVKDFNNGHDVNARKTFMNWRKPKDIIPRRKKEQSLFFDGRYSGNGMVNTYRANKAGKVLFSKGFKSCVPEPFRIGHASNHKFESELKQKSVATPIAIFITLITTLLITLWDQVQSFLKGIFS